LRWRGTCYRAHDPRWAYQPLSGEGAALRGGRFNVKGQAALYLSLSILGAVKEVNQGLVRRIDPCILCAYDIDCENIVDLRGARGRKEHGATLADMRCAWIILRAEGHDPPSWALARRLAAGGHAGMLVPSFAPGAGADDHNLVLWRWSDAPPHRVSVHDPGGRLPKDPSSWR